MAFVQGQIYINATDDVTSIVNDVFQYIYDAYKLDYNAMNKIYKDVEADGSFDDTLDDNDSEARWEHNFEPNIRQDDEYVYKSSGEYDGIDDWEAYVGKNKYIVGKYSNLELIGKIHSALNMHSPKKVKIKGVKEFMLLNMSGINNDVRGIRELDWKLYYWSHFFVKNESGISLDDLIVAAFKVKSHKFEGWYEMYCGIDNALIINDKLVAGITFDHGS